MEDEVVGRENVFSRFTGTRQEERILNREPLVDRRRRLRSLQHKICVLISMIFLIGLLFLSSASGNAMCPSGCTCHDESLEASCSGVELEFIPIQLNPELQALDLKENQISTIIFGFTMYSKLQHVDISVNKLTSLGNRNFENQNHLLTLNISHNQITSIEKKSFMGLTSLKSMDLSNNGLEKIHNHAFNDTVSLETLNLTRNRLTTLAGDAIFKNLQNLRVLILERNELLDVPSEALKSLPPHAQLSSLLLSYNLIQTLNETSFPFPQLSNLTKLTLSFNVVQDIHKSAFNSLHDLTWLDLSFNNLTQIPTQQLSKLSKLSALDLSGNELAVVGAVSFKSLFQLKYLKLSRMPHLSQIDARAFVDNIQLETISITENLGLERIPLRIFHGNPNLNHVHMQANSLTSLDAAHFPLDRLKTLDISENPLHCNCSLLWLWVLVRLQSKNANSPAMPDNVTVTDVVRQIGDMRALKVNLHNLKCMTPEELRMKPVGDIAEDNVRCETSWMMVAVCSAIVLALCTVLLVTLFLVLSGKRINCQKSKSHENIGSLESRGIITNSTHTPVLTLYPDKAYTSMLMNGYLMQPHSTPVKQHFGSMEQWDPFGSIGPVQRVGNEYTDQVPRMKKPPHIVYV